MSGERCRVCGEAANIFHDPHCHAYEPDAPEPSPVKGSALGRLMCHLFGHPDELTHYTQCDPRGEREWIECPRCHETLWEVE